LRPATRAEGGLGDDDVAAELEGVLAFSAEMGRRLGDALGPDMFFSASTASV